jgi:hypothetical protein
MAGKPSENPLVDAAAAPSATSCLTRRTRLRLNMRLQRPHMTRLNENPLHQQLRSNFTVVQYRSSTSVSARSVTLCTV